MQRLFEERQLYWERWWDKHGSEFLSDEELRKWNASPAIEPLSEDSPDKVDRAGIARLGAIFPTGADARLGPVQDVNFVRHVGSPFAVDFDRGRAFMQHEGQERGETWEKWMSRLRVDLDVEGGNLGLHTWMIDNSRWETIDQEILDPRPLKLDMEDRCFNDRDYHSDTGAPNEFATWLFHTREGASGILQVGPRHPHYHERTWRYRMWVKDIQPRVIPRPVQETPEQYADLRWDDTIEVTLQTAESGANCLWSFRDGNHVMPLPDLFHDENWTDFHESRTDRRSFFDTVHQTFSPQFPGVSEDVASQLSAVDAVCIKRPVQAYNCSAGEYYNTGRHAPNLLLYNTPSDRERKLDGFSPECFDDITPAEALAHRDRLYFDEKENEPGNYSIYPLSFFDELTTTLFRQHYLLILLQITEIDPNGDSINFRYKRTKIEQLNLF